MSKRGSVRITEGSGGFCRRKMKEREIFMKKVIAITTAAAGTSI